MGKHVNVESAIELMKQEAAASKELFNEFYAKLASDYANWESELSAWKEMAEEIKKFYNELLPIGKKKGIYIPYPIYC